MNKKLLLALLCASIFVFHSCRSDDDLKEIESPYIENPNTPDANSYTRFLDGLYGTSQTFYVELAYEEDAVPFSLDTDWEFTAANMEAIFSRRNLDTRLEIPWEVRSIPESKNRDFTPQRLLDLAEQHRIHRPSLFELSVFVIVVDGYLVNAGERFDRVVGVNIGNTSVVGVFRPVIDSVGTSENQKRNIEQATYIHEIGHALGLVRKGVPLATNHHDKDNEHHCINSECVMYYANEISSNMSDFISGDPVPKNKIVFDEACLKDIENY